jgi:hypothetical protein
MIQLWSQRWKIKLNESKSSFITRERIWMQIAFFLNVRKHWFPSKQFISYIKKLKNVTFILHFLKFLVHFVVFKSFFQHFFHILSNKN